MSMIEICIKNLNGIFIMFIVVNVVVINWVRTMPRKASRGPIVMVIFTIVIVAVVGAISFVALSPLLSNPPRVPILLDKTVMLTGDSYEQEFGLTLRKGDKLHVQVSGFGQPLDFEITNENRDELFVREPDISSFNRSWTAPKDGTYLFRISAVADNVKVRLTITKA